MGSNEAEDGGRTLNAAGRNVVRICRFASALVVLASFAAGHANAKSSKDTQAARLNNALTGENKAIHHRHAKVYDQAQDPAPKPRWYGGAEYLLWWVKGAPLSVPLVSTGPASTDEGILRSSQSTILYGAPFAPASGGNNTQNFKAFSGARLTAGYWLDDAQHLAVEASGFLLQRQSAGFYAQGDSTGSPGLSIPLYNSLPYRPGGACDPTGLCAIPLQEDRAPVSVPGSLTGSVSISNTLQLWGFNADAVMNFTRTPTWELSGLAGFRYLNLFETFNLHTTLVGLPNTMYATQSGYTNDEFDTRNQFYGALLGLRGRYTYQRFSAEATASLALGVSRETIGIAGFYQDFNYMNPYPSGPEGIFAMPSNEGISSSSRFAYVPEAQIKLGYDITPAVRVTVGYDFLFYSNVVRPTDQIDRNVPKGEYFREDPAVLSYTSPARLDNTTNFYAQGLSLGLAIRY